MNPKSNKHPKKTENTGSRQRTREIPVRWRILLLALCAYIVICIVVIVLLALNIYTSSPGASGNSTRESSAVVLLLDGPAVLSARSSAHQAVFRSPANTDWIDFDWS